MAGFMAFLAEVGAARDARQQAKTRWALEYYAGQARRGTTRAPGRRRAGAKPVATADKAVQ